MRFYRSWNILAYLQILARVNLAIMKAQADLKQLLGLGIITLNN